MNNKLFVGGLSYNTTQSTLQDAFAAHGTVSEVNVITDRMTGKSKGFAFITMGSDSEAQSAIEGLNGRELDGRSMNVSIAKPREERSGGGGGDRGYSGGGGGGGGGGRRGRF
jgi:cold-inducible RNA-binding protein